MKNSQKLVWKLIDREITEEEFNELQNELSKDGNLRNYYQNSIETDSALSNRHHTPFLNFKPEESTKSSKLFSFVAFTGWIAAVIVIAFAFFPQTSSKVKLVAELNADWRGYSVTVEDQISDQILHLHSGAIELEFPTKTKVVIEGPAFFKVENDSSLHLAKGAATVTHRGTPETFNLSTPLGKIVDIGTQFGVLVDHSNSEATVVTEVFEGNIKFIGNSKGETRFFNTGENAIIRGTQLGKKVKILANNPYANLVALPTLKGRSNQSKSPAIAHKIILESKKQDDASFNFDAVDLMLQDNLQAQINYSIVKGIAQAINQKTEILQKAQASYTPQNGVSFAEAAMQEIEAMGQSLVDSYVNFSKVRYWEACQTAEVVWKEQKNQEGQITHRIPHAQRLAKPKEGNKLLKNLEKIREWVTEVHLIHEEKGMGWASQFGCPEDGKEKFDKRNKNLLAISFAIDSIKSNLD